MLHTLIWHKRHAHTNYDLFNLPIQRKNFVVPWRFEPATPGLWARHATNWGTGVPWFGTPNYPLITRLGATNTSNTYLTQSESRGCSFKHSKWITGAPWSKSCGSPKHTSGRNLLTFRFKETRRLQCLEQTAVVFILPAFWGRSCSKNRVCLQLPVLMYIKIVQTICPP